MTRGETNAFRPFGLSLPAHSSPSCSFTKSLTFSVSHFEPSRWAVLDRKLELLLGESKLLQEELFIDAGYLGYVPERVASPDLVGIKVAGLRRRFDDGLLLPLESSGEARDRDDRGEQDNGHEHHGTRPDLRLLPGPEV